MQLATFVKGQIFFFALLNFFFQVQRFLVATKFTSNFNRPSEMRAAPSRYSTSSSEVLASQSPLGSPWNGPCVAGQRWQTWGRRPGGVGGSAHAAVCPEQLCPGSACSDGQRDGTDRLLRFTLQTRLLGGLSRLAKGRDQVVSRSSTGSSQDWRWYLLRLLQAVPDLQGWHTPGALPVPKETSFVPA